MKRVAIVGYAQHPILKNAGALNEVELIMPVVHQLFNDLGISQKDIDFTCSGSCDYLQGAAFAFVEGLSAIQTCLLYTSPSPRDQRGSRMPSSA